MTPWLSGKARSRKDFYGGSNPLGVTIEKHCERNAFLISTIQTFSSTFVTQLNYYRMIKYSTLLFSLVFSIFQTCLGQLKVEWSKSLGSIGEFYAGIEDSDGNMVLVGEANNQEAEHYAVRDFSILKVNQLGDLMWQQHFGGSGIDVAVSVCESSDKGYVFVGNSSSKDGDIPKNHGVEDLVAAKYSNSGKLVWKFVYGGSGVDNARKIIATSDGGFAIVGTSDSKDKDVSVNYGDVDCWVLKLSCQRHERMGNKHWRFWC